MPSAAHMGWKAWALRIVLSKRQLSRASSTTRILGFTRDTLNQVPALLAMLPTAGTGYMIIDGYLVALRAFIVVMVHLSVRHAGGMPGWNFRHENRLLAFEIRVDVRANEGVSYHALNAL